MKRGATITGNPCAVCQSTTRYASTHACVACDRLKSAKRWKQEREQRERSTSNGEHKISAFEAQLVANGRCAECHLLLPHATCLTRSAAELALNRTGGGPVFPESFGVS